MSIAGQMAPTFLHEIQSAGSVLIGTHLNPDGDALGSALAVSHYLDSLKIPNEVINHHVPPRNLEFLPGISRVKFAPKHEKHDLGIVVDLDSLDRLGNAQQYFAGCSRTMFIDHHIPIEQPGDVRIVDTTAPATAAILAQLMVALGVEIAPDMATCLLTGIVTDTGSFRFRNTTPESLSLAAMLLEHGGDINLVSEEIFQRKPLSSARLLGYCLEKMVLDCDNRLCWSKLEFEDFEHTHARDEDTEGFVNELLSIDTVDIAALVREPKKGRGRVSLRSRGTYDVAEVARKFGGGGHRNAAGLTFDAFEDDSMDRLVAELKACLASS